MESERFDTTERIRRGSEERVETWVVNATPLPLAPYSGIEAHVGAFTRVPIAHEMAIRIEVEDLFGKRYRTEVVANNRKP